MNISSAGSRCCPILLATADRAELRFLRDGLLKAGIERPLVSFNDAETLLDYLGAVCIADSPEPRLRPCLLLLDDNLTGGEKGDPIEWVWRQPALQHLRVAVLSDREPVRTDRAPGAVVQFVAHFPAAATLAMMVTSACGG